MDAGNILILIATFLGGALATVLGEWLRRGHRRTRTISLLERVNRNPLEYELKGLRLVREEGPGAAPVTSLRQYELVLQNTSDQRLRDAEIQFDFAADDIYASVTRPSLSRTAPVEAKPSPAEPGWTRSKRWKIPQLVPGDSLSFSFHAVNPKTSEFEYALYSDPAVIVRKTYEAPTAQRSAFYGDWFTRSVMLAAIVLVIVSFFRPTSMNIPTSTDVMVGYLNRPGTLVTRIKSGQYHMEVESEALIKNLSADFLSGERKWQWEYIYAVRNLGEKPIRVSWKSDGDEVILEARIEAGEAARQSKTLPGMPVRGGATFHVSGAGGTETIENVSTLRPLAS